MGFRSNDVSRLTLGSTIETQPTTPAVGLTAMPEQGGLSEHDIQMHAVTTRSC